MSAIATTITETLPRADALGAGSPGQFVLVQCATDYLPTALQSYLELPRTYADQHIVTDGTFRQVLQIADNLEGRALDGRGKRAESRVVHEFAGDTNGRHTRNLQLD